MVDEYLEDKHALYGDKLQARIELMEKIKTLKKQEKVMLGLLLHGYTRSEIAILLNLSRATITKQIAQLGDKLRDYLLEVPNGDKDNNVQD